jgi:hypothetical protein
MIPRKEFTESECTAIRRMLAIQIADLTEMATDELRILRQVESLLSTGIESSRGEVKRHINMYVNRLTPVQLNPNLIFELEQDAQETLQQIAVEFFLVNPDIETNEAMSFAEVVRKMLVAEEFRENIGIN